MAKMTRRQMMQTAAAATVLGLSASAYAAKGAAGMKRVTQKLVAPPFLPRHDQVAKGPPKVVKVRLVIEEKESMIAPNVKARVMTFNGSVPGPLIVVHQDDYLELTLVNPQSNTFLHNIDFHASTGALGGAGLTKISPGQQVVLRFKATRPGVFVYHCAPGGLMIPYHVVSGMNGAMMVLPRDGLKDEKGRFVRYDRAYYIGEQDFYVPRDKFGNFKVYNSSAEAMGDTIQVMKTLTPTHVVFNGAVGALTGKNAMKAKVGERVLFIHSQANRDTRPHLIGGHADLVWNGGSFADRPSTNLETWFIPGGSASAAMYKFLQPGIYAYVNHNLIEAIMLGAAGHVQVDGKWDNDLMKQVNKPGPIK